MELSYGTSEVEKWEYLGRRFSTDWYNVFKSRVHGLIFYRDGKRVSPADALALLRDFTLEKMYRTELDRLEDGRTRNRRRVVLGSGIALAGTAVLASSIPSRSAKLAGLGALAFLTGVAIQLTGHKHARFREQHTIHSNLFVHGALDRRLFAAILRFNHQVAAKCRYSGQVDVPMPAELARGAVNR